MVIFIMTGCAGFGTPPIVTIQGVELEIGEATPNTLIKQVEDIKLTDTYGNPAIGQLPARSWLQDRVMLVSDTTKFGRCSLYNPSSEQKFMSVSNIYRIDIEMPTEDEKWAEGTLINGIDFSGMDKEAVQSSMSNFKLRETEYGSYVYNDGDYRYIFRFNDDTGLVSEISVYKDIAKSYNKK